MPSSTASTLSVDKDSFSVTKQVEAGIVASANIVEDTVDAVDQYSPAQYKRLVFKTDCVILPILWLSWGLVQADKGSVSQQATFGISTDTHLHGQQFAWLTTLFFLAYLVAEFPANWLMQRVAVGKTVGALMIMWGVVVLSIAWAKDFTGLAALRFIQGILECSIGPAFLIITGSFYAKKEHVLRAFVWGTAPFSFGAVSNIAIYFIAKKAQVDNHVHAWRTISWFLGGLTIFTGILAFCFLGTPREVFWLSEEEKRMTAARTVSNKTGTDREKQPWNWAHVKECVVDPQSYFLFFSTLVNGLPNSGVQTFGNLVLKSFGFSPLDTILKGTLPINCYQFVLYMGLGFLTLRYTRIRFTIMMGALVPSIVCMFLLAFIPTSHSNRVGKQILYMLGQTGGISGFLIQTFIPSNIAGRTKRTVILTIVFVAYAAGNAIGPQVFRSTDAPRYLKGITVSATMYALELIIMASWRIYYAVENRRRDRLAAESGLSKEEQERQGAVNAENGMTDRQNLHFRYSV